MSLIDTHAHLDQDEFSEDRDQVIRQAVEAHVTEILAVGIGADSSLATIELAAAHPQIFAAVGIQPNYCAEAAAEDWDRIVALVSRPKVVAIGETGLDRHWDFTPFAVQQDYFDRHLRLSQQMELPFIVHTRESEEDVLAMLRQARGRGPLRGVMHSFVGNCEVAAECLELGLYISFAGMVTFKKSTELRSLAQTIPDDRILIETDSPYLAPHPLRGRRNQPAYLPHTAECLARERDTSFDDFCELTTANARRLFRF
jgi:TatD DNase family protein